MSLKKYPVGVDLGTSTIKVSCGEISYSMPSIIGDPLSSGWDGLVQDKSLLRNLAFFDEGNEIYVGELARLQSPMKKTLAAQGKMKSIKNVILAIKASLAIINVEMGWDTFILSTGVPIASSQDETLKISKALKGNHSFKIKNDATGKMHEISITVEQAYILPEPYGTYWQTLSTLGEKKAVDAIICDIGHGSTDLLCMYRGGIMRAASGSVEEATASLTNALSRTLQEKVGKIVRPFELTNAIKNGRRTLMVGGKAVDIGAAIDQATAAIADIIVDECYRLLNNLPPDAWIEKVIVTGGGAYIFGEYLKEAFVSSDIVKLKSEVIVPPDPVMCNAIGFESIAKTKTK